MGKGQDVPVFPVIVMIGLTVFGLAYIASEGLNLGGNATVTRDRLVFTSHSFGKVGSANQDFRTISFGDFTVGEARGDVLVDRRRKETVRNSLFSDGSVWIGYNATQPQGGEITFEVLGRSSKKALFVEVNGQKIFEEHLISGATPKIQIPEENLNHGMNTIRIGTNHGILSSNTYSIEDLRVTVNDRKFHDYTNSFQLYSYELQDFVTGSLTFSIRRSVKNEPLEVFINDRRIYSKRQVRISPERIEITPGNANLHPGYNSLRFTTDGESMYDIENAQIRVRYLGNTETTTVRRKFETHKAERDYADREDTVEKIRFDYQRLLPSPSPMTIRLNDRTFSLMPNNGENEIEFESSLLEEENVIEVRSNTTYQLNNLEVVSEKVEE